MYRKQRVVRSQRRAFTLVEVLLVLAILGVIAAMVVPQLIGKQKQAYIDATKGNIAGVEKALELYAVDHSGEFPTTGEGLEVLIQAGNNDEKWHGPYLKEAQIPSDPWGRPLQYEYPGTHNPQGTKPDIFSSGPDRAPNTADDITNWVTK